MSANTLIEYARNRGGEHPIPESYVDRWVPGWREVGDQGLSDLAALAEVRPDDAVRVALKFLAGEPNVVVAHGNSARFTVESRGNETAPAQGVSAPSQGLTTSDCKESEVASMNATHPTDGSWR